MLLLLYIIILLAGSIFDYKKRIIPDTINYLILLLAIVSGNIHFFGLLLGIVLLVIYLFKNFIGGGHIKFLLATGLFFGLYPTFIMFSKTILLIFFYINTIKIKKK